MNDIQRIIEILRRETDLLAACLKARDAEIAVLEVGRPLDIHVHDPWRFSPDPSIVPPYDGWIQHELVDTRTPTHPAACRETGTVEGIHLWDGYKPCSCNSCANSFFRIVRPLPGDASCLMGGDGVKISERSGYHRQPAWIVGNLNPKDNDKTPDFTIPDRLTWRPA